MAVQARAAARALFRGIAAAPEDRSARPAGFEPVRYRGHAIHQFAIGKNSSLVVADKFGYLKLRCAGPQSLFVFPLMCWH